MNSIAHSISDGCSTPVLGTINVGLKYTSYKVHISLSKLCPGPRKIIGRDRRHAFRSHEERPTALGAGPSSSTNIEHLLCATLGSVLGNGAQ